VKALARDPRRAVPALARAARLAALDRRVGHLKRFGEAAWLASRIPPDADHIHAHFAHAPASVALLLARLAGRPFSFTAHAQDVYALTTAAALRAKVGEAAFAVTVSEATRRDVAGAVRPADAAKVVVVRNGMDRQRFAPRAAEPAGPPTVLCVGRLVEKKGIDTLLAACGRLADEGVELRLELVGDGPMRHALAARARELGIGERVRFRGDLDEDAVLEAYRRAAVLALACRRAADGDRDGLPVVLVEAMACGLPVVTTPISGIPEVVRDGESGLLVDPDDPPALARAIGRVLRDGALRRHLGEGARAATAAYDRPATVARLRSLFAAGRPAEQGAAALGRQPARAGRPEAVA
jgi:glycosyltransferase involved in cell wall biosynthesis